MEQLTKDTIYISGKVSGIEKEAFEIFEKAEMKLIKQGWTSIINPMKLEHNHDKEWDSYMRIDLAELMKCSAILMLPNWMESRGARLEYINAYELGITIIEEVRKKLIGKPKQLNVDELLKEEFVQKLLTNTRREPYATQRQYLMALISYRSNLTHKEIGVLFKRNHSMVSYAKKELHLTNRNQNQKKLAYIDILKKHLFIAGYLGEY